MSVTSTCWSTAAFVLKVSNPAEDPGVIEMEVAAMAHLAVADAGLLIPAASRPATAPWSANSPTRPAGAVRPG